METKIVRKNADTGHIYLREVLLVTFFLPPMIHESVEALRQVLDLYLDAIPPDALAWSLIGANSETWKPISKLTLGKAREQLKVEAAARRKMTAFTLAGGEKGGEASSYAISVAGEPGDPDLPDLQALLELSFPMEAISPETVGKFVAFCARVAEVLPYVSGYAAPALQWTLVDAGLAARDVKALAMRHPGYDFPNNACTRLRLGKRVRGARWLTFLGPDLVARLGGAAALRATLSEAIAVAPAGLGLMLRAGALPEVGDVNRGIGVPLLCEVAKALEPITQFDDPCLLGQFAHHDQALLCRWERRFLG